MNWISFITVISWIGAGWFTLLLLLSIFSTYYIHCTRSGELEKLRYQLKGQLPVPERGIFRNGGIAIFFWVVIFVLLP